MRKNVMYEPSPFTAEFLRSELVYDPYTGLFSKRVTGEPYGYPHSSGYIMMATPGASVRVPKSRFPRHAHVMAWYYMTGQWPIMTVDHKNRVRSDNRWENLRLATMAQQGRNQSRRKNQQQFPGVSKNHNRWSASINHCMKKLYLGTFDTREEAGAAYEAKRRELAGEFYPEVTSTLAASVPQ